MTPGALLVSVCVHKKNNYNLLFLKFGVFMVKIHTKVFLKISLSHSQSVGRITLNQIKIKLESYFLFFGVYIQLEFYSFEITRINSEVLMDKCIGFVYEYDNFQQSLLPVNQY